MDRIDEKILAALKRTPSHPSEIARITKEPRTTVTYRLSRLFKHGKVQRSANGRKTIWTMVFVSKPQHEIIKTYYGDEILSAYSQLLLLPKNSVIWSVQGNEAAQGEFKNLPADFIKIAHRVFKRKKIILKGFSNTTTKKHLDSLNKDMLQSHIDRSVAVKLFENNFFKSEGELFVTKKLLLLCNPVKKNAVVIKDPSIVAIIKDLCEALFDAVEHIRSFDINKLLKEKVGK